MHTGSQPSYRCVREYVVVPDILVPSVLSLLWRSVRPRQFGRHFAAAILKVSFFNGNLAWKSNLWYNFSKICSQGSIKYMPALVQIMAGRRIGTKPLCEAIMPKFTDAYVYVTAAPLWRESSSRPLVTKGQWCGALHVTFGVNLNMPLDKRSSCPPPCWWYETPRRWCDIIETIQTREWGYISYIFFLILRSFYLRNLNKTSFMSNQIGKWWQYRKSLPCSEHQTKLLNQYRHFYSFCYKNRNRRTEFKTRWNLN